MSIKKCVQCLQFSNSEENRLATDECGHTKCRTCFIDEKYGCKQCIAVASTKTLNHTGEKLMVSVCPSKYHHKTDNIVLNSINDATVWEEWKNPPADEEREDTVNILSSIIVLPETALGREFRSEELTKSVLPPKLKRKHKSEKPLPENLRRLIGKNGSLEGFECNVCQRSFRSRHEKYYHLYCATPELKPFRCEKCSKRFVKLSHFNYHMETHDQNPRKFLCTECQKSFSSERSLKRHLKIHAGDGNLFKCCQCAAEYRDKTSFRAHLRRHEQIFPFKCPICCKKFTFKNELVKHEKTHNGEKRYFCDECDKKFLRRSTLNEHKKRHTFSAKIACDVCKNEFHDKKSLQRHLLTHKLSKKFCCPFCSSKSARRDNIIRHIRNMHPDLPYGEILDVDEIELSTGQKFLKNSRILDNRSVNNPVLRKSNAQKSHFIQAEAKIIATSSVIRSVGNVTPVTVPQDCDLISPTLLVSNSLQNSPALLPKTSKLQSFPCKKSTAQIYKKYKKKNDPAELYRKILFVDEEVNNDQDEDDLNSNQTHNHEGCCQNLTQNNSVISDTKTTETNGPSNFNAVHWRKKASQSFLSAL